MAQIEVLILTIYPLSVQMFHQCLCFMFFDSCFCLSLTTLSAAIPFWFALISAAMAEEILFPLADLRFTL